jgi:hypothetical protein
MSSFLVFATVRPCSVAAAKAPAVTDATARREASQRFRSSASEPPDASAGDWSRLGQSATFSSLLM